MAEAVAEESCGSTEEAGKFTEVSLASTEADSDLPQLSELDAEPSSEKIAESLTFFEDFYPAAQCAEIEAWIDDTAMKGSMGQIPGLATIDSTPHRTKYFFGHGYTYGRGKRGKEALLPQGSVSPVPDWLRMLVIRPLEDQGIVPRDWVNSVVMNDYRAGSSIVAHVDPPQLFARPIVTASFFWPARLVFGASFDPARTTPPAYAQVLSRGSVLLLDGYAANAVTHGIRPEDILGPRRVSLILRHVFEEAPKASMSDVLGISDGLAASWALVHQIQGTWQDPQQSSFSQRWCYLVQGLFVTVVCLQHGHRQPYSQVVKVWEMLPTQDGVICNGGLLTPNGVKDNLLTWNYLCKPRKKAGSKEFFTWMRAND